jgi:hypothetical protein
MMTSLIGIIGRRLVSVLSLVVTIVTFWAVYAATKCGETKLAIADHNKRSGFQKSISAHVPD